MENFIIVAVILLIVGGAVAYIIKEKKKVKEVKGQTAVKKKEGGMEGREGEYR